MVLASSPVDSDRRLAARPVGAHSRGFTPLAAMMVWIDFTRVVLPTPGPPVITSSLEESARRMASFWLWARLIASFPSTHGIALSASKLGSVVTLAWRRRICAAMDCSAKYRGARNTQGCLSTVSGYKICSSIS